MSPHGPRDPVAGPDSGPEPPFPLKLSGKVVKGFGRGSKEVRHTRSFPPSHGPSRNLSFHFPSQALPSLRGPAHLVSPVQQQTFTWPRLLFLHPPLLAARADVTGARARLHAPVTSASAQDGTWRQRVVRSRC